MCMMILPLALCAALVASAADTFSEDFENGTGRWHLPSAQWRVEDGAGRNGTKGLVLEYGKGEKPEWIEHNEMFPVEPGEAYRLEAWARDADFKAKDRPVSISLPIYDAKDKVIRGAGVGTKRVADNIIHPDGWYCVSGTSRPLPANAAKARLYIWAKEGSHGKVMFDDFRVTKTAVNPLDQLCCSAYRDEAAEGEVRFSAAYTVNPLKHPAERLHAEVRYVALKGNALGATRSAMATIKEGVASVALPVSAFALGTNEVKLALMDGNEVLGESVSTFARLERMPSRKVYFDEHKRTIVDGKPFFPLGMFWDDVNAKDLAVYTNAAVFNCLLPYKRPDTARMDLCVAAGVKVIYPICGFYELQAGTNVQRAAEYTAKYVDGLVDRFRSHPAMLAWYLADEIPVPYADLLSARNRMCREKDPDHPTYVVLNGLSKVRPLLMGYDCVGQDPYPIGCPHSKSEISSALRAAIGTRQMMYDSRAVWQVPQAFDWAYYASKTVEWRDKPGMRMPTREEMRSMTWQAIAGGANGIVYYYFEDVYRRGKTPEENARRWADLCAVAREVKDKEAVLLSEPGPGVEDVPKGIACRTWKTSDGKVHLLACNTTRAAVKGSVRVSGRECRIDLPPIGVVMREL